MAYAVTCHNVWGNGSNAIDCESLDVNINELNSSIPRMMVPD
jgi:hypothetical protein